MRQLHNFKIGKQDEPVAKLYEAKDLRETLNHAGMSVDDDTLYSCLPVLSPLSMHGKFRI